MVNLELYRVFYTVAKSKSITKAAEILYISQPAVSQAIKQLEKQLGGKLFNRYSRGMELTETGGKQMFEIVSKAIEMLDSAENKFTDLNNIATGQVRIAASDNVINYFLLKYIKEFKELYPNVSLMFYNETSNNCIDLVKSGKADIGFVNLPINVQTVNFTGQTGRIHDVFVASDKFSNLFGTEIEFSELSNYPLLLLDSSTRTRQKIDEFTQSLNIKLTPDFELASVELIINMAVEGFGIACVPKEYVTRQINNKQLTVLNVLPELPVREIGVITNKQEINSFAVNEFLKILNQ